MHQNFAMQLRDTYKMTNIWLVLSHTNEWHTVSVYILLYTPQAHGQAVSFTGQTDQ